MTNSELRIKNAWSCLCTHLAIALLAPCMGHAQVEIPWGDVDTSDVIATTAQTLDATDAERLITPAGWAAANAVVNDPDLRDYIAVLADTDSRLAPSQIASLAALIDYLKTHGYWADTALISYQRSGVAPSNAGALPNLGGWFASATSAGKVGTTTFTGSGLMLNGSDEGVAVVLPDLQSQSILTIFHRMIPVAASSPDAAATPVFWSFGDTGDSEVVALGKSSGSLSGETLALIFKDGTIDGRIGTDDISWAAQSAITITTEIGPAGCRMWGGTTQATLDLTLGMSATTAAGPVETNYTADNIFRLGYLRNSASNTSFFEGELAISLILRREVPAPDRAALIGLIEDFDNPTGAYIWFGDSLTEANHTAGWADAGNTRRLTPPTRHMEALVGAVQVNRGASGETAAQIAARWSARWNSMPTIVWAGTNDKDDTDEEGVVDEIESIIDALDHSEYVVITPIVKTAWTSPQKANIAAIRAEIMTRFPSNYLDAWAVDNTTDGTPDAGYLRWQSVNTEDDLHPNDAWYADLVADLKAFIEAKGWL